MVDDYGCQEQEGPKFRRGVWGLVDLCENLKETTISEAKALRVALSERDWEEVKRVGWRNKGIVLGVVLPAMLFPFSPAVVGMTVTGSVYMFSSLVVVLALEDKE